MSLITPLWPQWLAALEVFMLQLVAGMCFGWIAPFLEKILDPNSPFAASKEDTTWIASLMYFGKAVGIILAMSLFRLGAKPSLYFTGLIFLIGHICLLFANSVKVVFIFFLCSGTASGLFYCMYPIYIGEISHPTIRGALISLVITGFTTGKLLGNVADMFIKPWVFAFINIIICVLFVITFYFFPNSSHYLVSSGKNNEAAKSIQWYNRDIDVDEELKKLQIFHKKNRQLPLVSIFRKLNTPTSRRILIMTMILGTFDNLSGMFTVEMYVTVLLTKSGMVIIDPDVMVIVMNFIGIFASLVAMYVTDKVERTTTILVGCMALSVGYITWGVDYHLLELGGGPNLQWLVIFAALVFRISVSVCILPVISILMSELFAPDIKTMSLCLLNVFCAIEAFIVNKYFQFIVDNVTHKYVFYFFAVIIALMGIYVKIFFPTTNGKSLQEIQEILNDEKESEELAELRAS